VTERFDAPLVVHAKGAHVVVPDSVIEALGGAGRIPVKASFDGVDYRGSVVTMGGERIIGVTKAIREQIGKVDGDTVEVALVADTAERTVDVPADLATALQAAGLRTAFDGLAYTHRKEHVRAIEEAKKPETRARRIEKALEMLRA
jgi:hypothetical protein